MQEEPIGAGSLPSYSQLQPVGHFCWSAPAAALQWSGDL